MGETIRGVGFTMPPNRRPGRMIDREENVIIYAARWRKSRDDVTGAISPHLCANLTPLSKSSKVTAARLSEEIWPTGEEKHSL